MATPTEALQLITTYKYFQAEYHRRGLAAFAGAGFSTGQLAIVQQMAKQTAAHVTLLRTVLGTAAPTQPAPDTTYDYTGKRAADATAPFANVFTTVGEFFKLLQLLADFEVRAIKGMLPDLSSNATFMLPAVQIHSVAGRHAAESRMLRGSGTTRATVSATTTSFLAGVAYYIDRSGATIYDAGTTATPNGFQGSATDPASQAYIATLVYGTPTTGAAANTTPTDGESNPIQRGYGPVGADAFDEPVPAATVYIFLARFNAT